MTIVNLLLIGGLCSGMAQASGAPPIPGRWAPTLGVNRTIDNLAAPDPDYPLTTEQERALNAVVQDLDRIFRAAGSLNPPSGVEALLYGSTGFHPGSVEGGIQRRSNDPIPLSVSLLLFRLFRDCPTCPVQRESEAHAGMLVWINDRTAPLDTGPPEPASPSEPYWFLAPRLMGQTHGFDVWEGGHGRVIMPANERPLFLPVSKEEYLTRLLRRVRAGSSSAQTQSNAAIAEQDAALEEMERAIREMEPTNPQGAAELRRQLAEVRRQLPSAREQTAAELREGVTTMRDLGTELERELGSLTPAERSAPAYVAAGPPFRYRDSEISVIEDVPGGDVTVQPSGLVPSKSPGGRMVVRTNPDFFDRRLPPTAVQLIVLGSFQGGDPTSAADEPSALMERKRLDATLDWRAFLSLLSR